MAELSKLRKKGVTDGDKKRSKRQSALIAAASVMPMQQAKKVAGYGAKYSPAPAVYAAIEEQRELIRNTKGYTLEDSATFAKSIRDSKTEQTGDRLRANSQMADLLGLNAPLKTEITETREITASVSIIHEICARLGTDPNALRRAVSQDITPMSTLNVYDTPQLEDNTSTINVLQVQATDCESVGVESGAVDGAKGCKVQGNSKSRLGRKKKAGGGAAVDPGPEYV